MKRNPSILLSIFFLLACDGASEDCSTVNCVGPPNLVFEVLSNGANVFDEGQFVVEDVTLTGQNSDAVQITVSESNFRDATISLLFLEGINWQPGTNSFLLSIGQDFNFMLKVEIELSTGQCCGGIPIAEEYRVDGVLQENPKSVVTLVLE